MKHDASQMHPPGLYLVATPIGNLRDISLRALDVLGLADLIACEDTRVTAKLLTHYGIQKPTVSYNDHNGDARRPQLLKMLADGKRVALVSDAGTPLISDPGYKLAKAARAAGHYVTAIPGASSVLTALSLCGLPTDRFFFAGFIDAKKDASGLADIPATLVLFEAARRLPETLRLLRKALGDREAAIARELTKRFEDIKTGRLSELADLPPPKGEAVIVIAPPGKKEVKLDLESTMKTLLASHGVKEAASILAEQTGRPRKEIYALALRIKDA